MEIYFLRLLWTLTASISFQFMIFRALIWLINFSERLLRIYKFMMNPEYETLELFINSMKNLFQLRYKGIQLNFEENTEKCNWKTICELREKWFVRWISPDALIRTWNIVINLICKMHLLLKGKVLSIQIFWKHRGIQLNWRDYKRVLWILQGANYTN